MNSALSATMSSELRSVLEKRYGHDLEIPKDLQGLPELLRMANQTSHRAWSSQQVSPALVKLLAACALSAPTKSFLQQVDIVDVRDPQRRNQIHSLVPAMPWMADAPVLLVFCANGRRFRHLFERRGKPFTNNHLDGFFNPTVDAALVMMNFINAASAAGLVACPISMIRNEPQQLKSILELPELVVPVAGLCLGWPVHERSVNPRLSLDATFHVDRIGLHDDDTAISEFDQRYVAARTRSLAPDSPDPRAWSEERVEQYATPQRADWGHFVRDQNFDLS